MKYYLKIIITVKVAAITAMGAFMLDKMLQDCANIMLGKAKLTKES